MFDIETTWCFILKHFVCLYYKDCENGKCKSKGNRRKNIET